MVNYQKSKIYTIRYRLDNTLIYVGSTVQVLSKRFNRHIKTSFNEKETCKLYTKIRETNDINNWYIELYENYPCNCKEELRKKEGEIIRLIGNLNTYIAGRTKNEWKNECRNEINKQSREYYQRTKHIKENKNKEIMICSCGRSFRKDSLNKHLKSIIHIKYNEELIN